MAPRIKICEGLNKYLKILNCEAIQDVQRLIKSLHWPNRYHGDKTQSFLGFSLHQTICPNLEKMISFQSFLLFLFFLSTYTHFLWLALFYLQLFS